MEPKTRLGAILRTQLARAASVSSASTSTSSASSAAASAAAKQESRVLETILERVLRDAEREEGDAWVGLARGRGVCTFPTLSLSSYTVFVFLPCYR